jgi:hypothetical protein
LIIGRSLLLHQLQRRAIKLPVVIIAGYETPNDLYKILYNIPLSRLSPYIDEIIRVH